MLKQEPLATFDNESFKDRNVRGAIVSTASISGLVTLKDFAAYASSKHAVTIMTKQLAREYAPLKIRINSVCPGVVNTPAIAAAGLKPEFEQALSKQAPMNRWVHADEVAEAAVFLCSSRASAITGVNLPVDCGAALYHLV
jgi:NAD(P)-dependent dehydrogenase (short-subunit alcohol dehydrogenase family)